MVSGIDTVEQLARVKAVVAQSVVRNGYAILNADDDLVYNERRLRYCKIAYFSCIWQAGVLKNIVKKMVSQLCMMKTTDLIYIQKGAWKIQIEKAHTIPLTQSGKALFNVMNIMPAVLTVILCGSTVVDIRQALQTFIPSPGKTPSQLIYSISKFPGIGRLCT